MTRYLLVLLTVDDNDIMTYHSARHFVDASASLKEAQEWVHPGEPLTPDLLEQMLKRVEEDTGKPSSFELMSGVNKIALLEKVEVY